MEKSTELDISKLISKAEDLVYSGMTGMAEEGKAVVQEIEIAGHKYVVEIVVRRKDSLSSEYLMGFNEARTQAAKTIDCYDKCVTEHLIDILSIDPGK
jgi:6-pyruvoyl-tetrahydropterin synthase